MHDTKCVGKKIYCAQEVQINTRRHAGASGSTSMSTCAQVSMWHNLQIEGQCMLTLSLHEMDSVVQQYEVLCSP